MALAAALLLLASVGAVPGGATVLDVSAVFGEGRLEHVRGTDDGRIS